MTIQPIEAMELSAQELDEVAGGASRRAEAFVSELQDAQISTLKADRNGVSSTSIQFTNDFEVETSEAEETGNP